VVCSRARADEESTGDLLVGQSLGEQGQASVSRAW
jgi:hypothetical protein